MPRGMRLATVLLLRTIGVAILIVVPFAALAYVGFMVVWMHVRPLPVLGVTAILAFPAVFLGWAALRFEPLD